MALVSARCPECKKKIQIDNSLAGIICPCCNKPILTKQVIIGSDEKTENDKENSAFDLENGVLKAYNGKDMTVYIPDGVRGIGVDALRVKAIDSLYIPDSIKEVELSALGFGISKEGFLSFDEALLPFGKTLKKISIGAGLDFKWEYLSLYQLESISVSKNNPYMCVVDGVLMSRDKKTIYKYPADLKGEEYTVPDTVESIAPYAFYGCSKLQSIDLGKVKKIGKVAFYKCNKLDSITFSECLEVIGEFAFRFCSNLYNLVIPDSVRTIGSGAFFDAKFSELTLPKSLAELEPYPPYITYSSYCWASPFNEVEKVIIPGTISKIPSKLFSENQFLKSVTIENGVEEIGESAFENCRALENVSIPDSIRIIGVGAFHSCSALSSLRINAPVVSVGAAAFYQCKGLEYINSESITSIGAKAFSETGIEEFRFSNQLFDIEEDAFYQCRKLKDVGPCEDASYGHIKINGKTYSVRSSSYGAKGLFGGTPFEREHFQRQYELEEKNKKKSQRGCYVATCVYGSYDCPQVWTLRRFRDNTLAKTWYGRAFIRLYYTVSPKIVKWFGSTEWFRKMWKGTLDRMVRRLNSNGVKDSPYEDNN